MKIYWKCSECNKEFLSKDIEEIHFNLNEYEAGLDAKIICKACFAEKSE
jgi:hypothetical protein